MSYPVKSVLFFSLTILSTVSLLLLISTGVNAATYYMGPDGKDGNAGSYNAPWARFEKAMSVLRPGDTLLLKDGTYNSKNSGMLNVTVSGNPGNFITVKALNDGAVTIDGEHIATPCSVSNVIYTVLEGVICRNSIANALVVSTNAGAPILTDGSFYNIVRRVSAYDAGGHSNVILLHNSNILLEDCIEHSMGNGYGYIGIGSQKNGSSTSHITIRRCIAFSTGDPAIAFYETNDSDLENNIVFHTGQSDYHWGGTPWGMQINATDYDQGINNTMRGNLAVGNNTGNTFFAGFAITDRSGGGWNIGTNTIFENNVVIDPYNSGIYQNNGTGVQIRNNTTIFNRPAGEAWSGTKYNALRLFPWFSSDQIGSTITNNSHSGNGGINEIGFGLTREYQVYAYAVPVVNATASYNNYYGFASPYADLAQSASSHDTMTNPDYPTSVYGYGAFLMPSPSLKGRGSNGADIGAEILYRYQDGVLTNVPLWPWPMESRAIAELGMSITYVEDDKGNTGGIWKTLEGVYEFIALSSHSIEFTAIRTTQPADRNIEIYNSGGGTLKWTATVSHEWLSVYPARGTGDATITVSADTTGLPAGTYTGAITITAPASNSPQLIHVTMTIRPRPPVIQLTQSVFNIGTVEGSTPAGRTVTISNGGDESLNWTATVDAASRSWLSVNPGSGLNNSDLMISFNSAGLKIGTYSAVITITSAGATNSPQVVNIGLKVSPQAVFAANSGGGQFAGQSGNVYQADKNYTGGYIATITSSMTGTTDGALYQSMRYGNFTYNIPLPDGSYIVTLRFAEINWNAPGKRVFNVSLQGARVISNLDIFAKAGINAAYDVYVPVGVTGGMLNINFSSVVDNAMVSAIEVFKLQAASSPTLNFSTEAGINPAVQTFSLSYSDGSTLRWTALADITPPAWLSVSPSGGSGSSVISASVNSNALQPGTYSKAIVISAPGAENNPQTINVTLTVKTPAAGNSVVAINSGGWPYTSQSGTTYQDDRNYSGGFITATASAITGTPDGTLYQSERYGDFSYNIPLANGAYSVTLKFAEIYWDVPGKRVFDVSMQGARVIENLDIYARVGKNAAYDVTVPVTVANEMLDIDFTPVSDHAKISALLITRLSLSTMPAIELAPASLSFSTAVGSNPSAQTIELKNIGSGVLDWTVTVDNTAPAWLSVSRLNGKDDATLAVSVNASGLAQGVYTKAVIISATGAVNAPQIVNVSLIINPPGPDGSIPLVPLLNGWGGCRGRLE